MSELCIRCGEVREVVTEPVCGGILWKCSVCGKVLDQDYDDPSDWDVAMYGMNGGREQ